jgi:hypothetical protein
MHGRSLLVHYMPNPEGMPSFETFEFQSTRGCNGDCRIIAPPWGSTPFVANLRFTIRNPQEGFVWRVAGTVGDPPPNYVGFLMYPSEYEGSAATAGPFNIELKFWYAGGGSNSVYSPPLEANIGNGDTRNPKNTSCRLTIFLGNGR